MKISTEIVEGICDDCSLHTGGINNENLFNDNKIKKIFLNKIASIYLNLRQDSVIGNKNLLNRIKSGEIDPKRLAFLPPEKIYPERWESLINEVKANEKYIDSDKQCSISNVIHCLKCKMKNTISYFSLQTRSLDEPSKIFYECINPKCRNKWSVCG